MNLLLNNPANHASLIGLAICAMAATFSLYLWRRLRTERYLLFWGIAWLLGMVRAGVHIPANSIPALRMFEILLIPVALFFLVLASYDLLPSKPWRHRYVVVTTAVIMFGYGMVACLTPMPLVTSYALSVITLAFATTCTWISYRMTRLSGYVFASVTCFCYGAFLIIAVVVLHEQIA